MSEEVWVGGWVEKQKLKMTAKARKFAGNYVQVRKSRTKAELIISGQRLTLKLR